MIKIHFPSREFLSIALASLEGNDEIEIVVSTKRSKSILRLIDRFENYQEAQSRGIQSKGYATAFFSYMAFGGLFANHFFGVLMKVEQTGWSLKHRVQNNGVVVHLIPPNPQNDGAPIQ